jgi:hypothetical protein
MKDASYYRMMAKDCFDKALAAKDNADAETWRRRGQEYGELALKADAENGKGGNPPAKLPKEE